MKNENLYDISVIIPVYNGEKYIDGCLYSISIQDMALRLQTIIINDGSTDGTLQKLDDCQKKYPGLNITIISQDNMGVSVARNKGLEKATGKYVSFVDIDDWVGISPEFVEEFFYTDNLRRPRQNEYNVIGNLETIRRPINPKNFPIPNRSTSYFSTMFKTIEKTHADVVFGGKLTINEPEKYVRLQKYSEPGITYSGNNETDKHNAIQEAYARESANFALYNRNFLEKNKLQFEPNMQLDEDILFCMNATLFARRIATEPRAIYAYNRHSQPLSTDKTEQQLNLAKIQCFSTFLLNLKFGEKFPVIYNFWFKKFLLDTTIKKPTILNKCEKCKTKHCTGCKNLGCAIQFVRKKLTEFMQK